jgi:hypothetical protein
MGDSMIELLTLIQTVVLTITLIILIIENRTLRKTIYASNYGKMIDMLKELRLLRINDPELAKVYETEVKNLSPTETRYHFFNLIVLSILEMLFVDMKLGLITKDTWQFWLKRIQDIANEKSFRQMVLRQSYKIVNPEFCKIVEEIVKDVEQQESKKFDASKSFDNTQ